MSGMRRWGPWVLLVVLAGCGGARRGADGPGLDRLAPTHLYPLVEGNVWSYNVRATGEALPTLHIQRVTSVRGDAVEIEAWSDKRELYEIREGSIYRPRYGAWLIKAPVRVGAKWPSASGRTATVTSVDEHVEVPAGRFEGCVRVEEQGGEAQLSGVTVYCPGVGPVYVESSMRARTTGATVRNVGELLGYELANER
jgi:hypothetical protein